MSALADINPNFASADDETRELTSRDVMPNLFESGMVTANQEDIEASAWEKEHCRAVLRMAEVPQTTRTAYKERKRFYDEKRAARANKTLDMDPDVAKEELQRLMRSGAPAEHANRINDLRTQVLGLDPIDFSPPPPPETTTKPVEELTPEQVRQKKFLDIKKYTLQEKAVAKETDIEFLRWMTTVPAGRLMPVVKKAAAARIEELQKAGN